MNKIIKLSGLDCAECARELEEELNKIDGVETVSVDFFAQKVRVNATDSAIEAVIYACEHFEEVKVLGEERASAYDKKLKIKGLCCANCARELEEELNKIEGVSANVDFMNMCVTVTAENKRAYDSAIYTITHFEEVEIVDGAPKQISVWAEHMRELIGIAVGVLGLTLALIFNYLIDGTAWDIAAYVLYGVAYLAVGYKVLILTAKNIVKGKIFDENFLMTVASLGAMILGIVSGDGFFEGVAVILLYQVGELFQALAVGSSRRSISELMNLKSQTATVKTEDGVLEIEPEDVRVGDILIIKAGEKVPVDCVITSGSSALDTKALNGEPIPKDVGVGDSILSGSINVSGVIEARAEREYKNSAVAKILELVENSTATKAKSEKFITKFAKYYTPAVCCAAAVVAGLIPTLICAVNSAYSWGIYSEWIYKALNFLVISCPCALVISVPLSYFSGIGRCADFGILVKGSTNLDALAKCVLAAFDKTGTLTEGTFKVVKSSSDRALKLAATAEKFSSHPIAAAFSQIEGEDGVESAREIAGKGVECVLHGKILLCGNARLLEENGVAFERLKSSSTLVYVAFDGEYMGVIYIDDVIKEDAKEALALLKASGVQKCVMLTGDSVERAEAVASSLGLDGYEAGLLPDEKLSTAESLKTDGGLIYVGDGINDAPVMVTSDCAVSMGKTGSDAAIEASDIVLLTDNLRLLPKARKIAKGTRRVVYENIIGSLAVKLIIMVLSVSITGFPLIVGIIGDVGVMIAAVLNAMRIKINYKN